jgi:alkylation response protein AidB-like acyl-CoA dehydrogenase
MNDSTQDTERQENLRMLRESAQSFALKESPLTRARALRGSASGFDRAFWQQLAEQGWTGLLVPEAADGYGQGFAEMAAVIDALATQVAPEPVTPALVFASRLIQHSGDGALQTQLLSRIAAGELIPAVAWQEAVAAHQIDLAAARTMASGAGDKLQLSGEKHHLRPGADSDGFIVSAVNAAGEQLLLWVPADTPGIAVATAPLADGCGAARVTFDKVTIAADHCLARGAKAVQALTRAYDEALVMSSVELLALQRAMLSMTLEYLRTRKQFGKAIGEFQALQHRAAQLYIDIEITRAAVLKALQALDADVATAASAVAVAKARAGTTATRAVQEGVQMHGGMGMTDQFDIGFFMKRARVCQELFGDTAFHAERLAELKGY